MKWAWRIVLALIILGIPAIIIWHDTIWWWIEIHTGTVHESGPYYGFFSGFGSDLGEYAILVSVITATVSAIRHINCHAPGCPRVGRYQLANGEFKVCSRHHPTGGAPSLDHIHARHEEEKLANAKLDEIHRHVSALTPTAGTFPPPSV